RRRARVGQRTGRAPRGRPPSVRTVLLVEAEGNRPRPGDRAADDRGPRRTDHGRVSARHRHGLPHRASARCRGRVVTDPASVHSAAAVIYAVPALVWAVLTRNYLLVIRTRLPRRPLFAIFPTCTGLVALVYVIMTIGTLGASEPGLVPQRLLTTVLVVALVALGPVVRHLIVGTGSLVVTDTPTTPAWLAGNYGAGAGIAAVALRFVLRPGDAWITGATIATAGFVVMVIVAGWEMRGRVQ